MHFVRGNSLFLLLFCQVVWECTCTTRNKGGCQYLLSLIIKQPWRPLNLSWVQVARAVFVCRSLILTTSCGLSAAHSRWRQELRQGGRQGPQTRFDCRGRPYLRALSWWHRQHHYVHHSMCHAQCATAAARETTSWAHQPRGIRACWTCNLPPLSLLWSLLVSLSYSVCWALLVWMMTPVTGMSMSGNDSMEMCGRA